MYRSRIVKRGLITIGIVFGVIALEEYYNDSIKYDNCKEISEWFNAKPVTYQDKTYQVKACGDGKGITGSPEKIKVSVYAPNGGLVAVRRFTANFLAASINPLEYKPEGVEYWDDYYGPVIIRMPPTWIDKVWARIPNIDGIPPFYIDKEAIEQEVARATAPRSVAPVLDPDEPVIPNEKAEARLRTCSLSCNQSSWSYKIEAGGNDGKAKVWKRCNAARVRGNQAVTGECEEKNTPEEGGFIRCVLRDPVCVEGGVPVAFLAA